MNDTLHWRRLPTLRAAGMALLLGAALAAHGAGCAHGGDAELPR